MTPYLKAVAAAVVPFILIWIELDTVDWRGAVAAVVTSLAVYLVPNRPNHVG